MCVRVWNMKVEKSTCAKKKRMIFRSWWKSMCMSVGNMFAVQILFDILLYAKVSV